MRIISYDENPLFRDFEERDIDFIYHCKNDEKLNSMIVGQWYPFTYEEAVKWYKKAVGNGIISPILYYFYGLNKSVSPFFSIV